MRQVWVFDAPGFEAELEGLLSDRRLEGGLAEWIDRELGLLVAPGDGRPVDDWRQRYGTNWDEAAELALTRWYDPTAELGIASRLEQAVATLDQPVELGEVLPASLGRLVRYRSLVLIRKRLIDADADAGLLRQLRVAQASRRGLLLR